MPRPVAKTQHSNFEARAKELPPRLEAALQAALDGGKSHLIQVEGELGHRALVRADASLWMTGRTLPEAVHGKFVRVRFVQGEPNAVGSPALVELEKAYGQFHDAKEVVNLVPSPGEVAGDCGRFQYELNIWTEQIKAMSDFAAARLEAQGANLTALRLAINTAHAAAQKVIQEAADDGPTRGRPARPSLVQFISCVRGVFWDHWASALHPLTLELETEMVRLILHDCGAGLWLELNDMAKWEESRAVRKRLAYWMAQALPSGRSALARAAALERVYFDRNQVETNMPPVIQGPPPYDWQ